MRNLSRGWKQYRFCNILKVMKNKTKIKKVLLGTLYGFPYFVEIPESALPEAEKYCKELIHELNQLQMREEVDPVLAKAFKIPFKTKHYKKEI